jgi:hypothetical protein
MRFINVISIRKSTIILLMFLASITLIYAQHPQQSAREEHAARSAPAPRSAPAQRSTAVVDRANHGTIRHVDTQVIQRPAVAQRVAPQPAAVQHAAPHPVAAEHVAAPAQRRNAIVHRDVDADVGRAQHWHSFVYGARHRDLRAGYIQMYVGGSPYYYDDGIYYQQLGDEYQEVYPPVGAGVAGLPDGAIALQVGDFVYYYAGGAFYVQQDGGFIIVAPPIGAMVPELPPGSVQIAVGGGVAYQFNGICYRPVFMNGVTQYMTFMS